MSEFDINLIRAFAKCPAFYDKRNPNFKDRIFTENAWKELSLQLGFDDKILRDRMFQLRNRYNLEKRKVEMMVQDGETDAKSTWPLFEYMTFLDGHIRPRKSYKSIMSRAIDANHHPHHHPHNQQHPMNTNSVLMPRHSTNFRNYNPLNMALNRSLMQQQQRQQQQPFYNMAGMQQDQQLHQSLVDCDIDLSGTLASNGIIGDEDKGGHFYQPNPGQNGMNGDSGMMPSTSYEASDNTSDIKMELFSDTDDEEGNDMTNDDEENNNSRSSNQNNNTNPSSNNNNGNGPTNGQQQPSSNQGAAAGNGAQQQQQGGGDDNDEDVHFINPVDLLAMAAEDENDDDSTNCDKLERSSLPSNNNNANNSNNTNNNDRSNDHINGNGTASGGAGEGGHFGASEVTRTEGDHHQQDPMRTTTSLKSMQNQQNNFSLNVRQMEALKRTAAAAAAAVSGQEHQQSPSTGQHQQQMNHHSNSLNFKRRRRNYHQMVINGVNNPHFSSTDHGPSPSSSSHHHHNNQGGQTLNSSMRPARPNSLLPNSAQMAMMAMNGLPNSAQMSSHHHSTAFPASLFCANASPGPLDKYSAFGQFVASSLAELPELKALDIVAKFTSHLIHALREHKTDSQSVDDKQRTF